MIHVHDQEYPYLEEINEGILGCVPHSNGSSQLVLDVGCGSGALSQAISERGYRVWGVEPNPEANAVAAGRIEKVMLLDLQQVEEVKRETAGEQVDLLVFSDVLEHVYDPYAALTRYMELLAPGGLALVSLPNMAVWSNRLRLLFGNFNYKDTGVRDRTHIRFFTFNSARRMVEAAGCEIVQVDFTPYFVRALLPLVKRAYLKGDQAEARGRQIADSPAYRLYMKLIYPVEKAVGRIRMQLFAFRIIIVGRKI